MYKKHTKSNGIVQKFDGQFRFYNTQHVVIQYIIIFGTIIVFFRLYGVINHALLCLRVCNNEKDGMSLIL